MENDIVIFIQKYIKNNIDSALTLAKLARVVNYSPYYVSRLFKRVTGLNLFTYIRKIRLTEAAKKLRNDDKIKIIDVALDFYFDSHEGFTRAFYQEFAITPKNYQIKKPPIKYFIPYLMESKQKERGKMTSKTIFVQVMERPLRKAIIKRGITANEYFAYCNEVGCDIFGILSSIKEAISEPIGMWLSDSLRRPDTSLYVQGVEVPFDYSGVIPDGFEVITLPATKMIIFQGEPYEEDEFRSAIGDTMAAIQKYDPKIYGFQYNNDGYRFQYEPIGERGYIEGRTIISLKNNI